MSEKARHAFGNTANLDSALASGVIDAYDILFLDGDTEPKVGWIDKNGTIRLVENKGKIVRVDELPQSDGNDDVVYIYNNECYIWDGEQCIPMAKTADLTNLETQVSRIEEQIGDKVDATTVQAMVNAAVEEATSSEVVEF